VVTFTSSSTVRAIAHALGDRANELLSKALLATIGPVTADTARELGLTVGVSASEYTVAGLLDALERHFQSGEPAARTS
jgi:uroporphyrinogen III methyltransferase/synthase